MKKYKVFKGRNVIFMAPFSRYKFKSLGKNLRLGGKGNFYNSQNITIEDDVYIGRGFYFEAISEIIIETGTMIGPNVTIIAGTHNYNSTDLKAVPYDNSIIDTPVIIGKNVWIGANVSICPGTIIEEGAVVGMGAVVSGVVPSASVVVSNKQHILKYRNKEQYEALKKKHYVYNKTFAGKPFHLVKKRSTK